MKSHPKPVSNNKEPFIYLLLGGIIIIGFTVFMISTKWGVGLSDDSYHYVFPAQDYLNGTGFHPSLHYPPVLTLLLLIPGSMGIELMDAARWLNAGLFGVNIALICYLIWYLRRSFIYAMLIAASLFAFGFIFELHAWLMSEALFLFFTLWGSLSLIKWFNSQRYIWLILSGFFFGMSTATRYIGISGLIAGVILIMLFIKPRNHYNTLRFIFSGILPIIGMILLGVFRSGGISDRSIGYYPLDSGDIFAAVNAMIGTILPGRFVAGFEIYWLVIVLTCIALGGWFLLFKYQPVNGSSQQIKASKLMMIFCYTYCVIYLVILIPSRLFFDPLIPFDTRLLGPMLVVGVLLIAILIGETWRRMHPILKWGLSLMLATLLLVNGIRTINTLRSYYQQGRGYNSARDHISETYAYLRRFPDTPIYSNAPAALYFWLGRHTYALPGPEGLDVMKTRLRKEDGFIVLFDSIPLELYHLNREQVIEGLTEWIDLSEATIYSSADSK